MEGELAPAPVSYGTLTHCTAQVILLSQERSFMGRLRSNFCSIWMNFDDLLVVLRFLLFTAGKLNECLGLLQAVVVPLLQPGGETSVVKEITRIYVVGGATMEPWRGRAMLVKNRKLREFNPTSGYPGQDISS